jgi:YbbR domain-containing protein
LKKWLASLGRNRLLKLLSLLLAVTLWFAVSGEERTETTLNMSLELVNLPPKLMITSEVPPALQVRATGPRSIINKLSESRLVQTIDLSGQKSGRPSFYLGPNSFSFPRGVVVSRIQPNPITLTLATAITRTLPIKPVLEGKPPVGYEVKEVKTRPAQVTVRGPYPELTEIKFIATLPIDVSHLTEQTIIATDLDFKNLHLTLKEQVPILADIFVEAKLLTRSINGVPVVAQPNPARLQPSKVSLTLKGPWNEVKDLKPQEVKATVDTTQLSPGHHRLKVSINLPPGISLVRVRPDTVSAKVMKSP